MLTERGAPVDDTTIYRWVQNYGPELDKRTRWYRKGSVAFADSWRVDETYIRVGGRWCYLYRAVTKDGRTLDFYMSTRRNTTAATRFLGKALRSTGHRVRNGEEPSGLRVICTDKAPTYAAAIKELIDEHKLSRTVVHRQVKHLGQCDRGGSRPAQADPGSQRWRVQESGVGVQGTAGYGGDARATQRPGQGVRLRVSEPGCGDRRQGLHRRLRDQGYRVVDRLLDQRPGTARSTLQQHPLEDDRAPWCMVVHNRALWCYPWGIATCYDRIGRRPRDPSRTTGPGVFVCLYSESGVACLSTTLSCNASQ